MRHIEILHAGLGERGHVWQDRGSLPRRDGERLQLTGLDLRHGGHQHGKVEVHALLEKAFEALSDPEVKERLASSGAEITPMSAEQFAKFLQSETDKYTTLIRTEFCSNLWYGGCGGFDWR